MVLNQNFISLVITQRLLVTLFVILVVRKIAFDLIEPMSCIVSKKMFALRLINKSLEERTYPFYYSNRLAKEFCAGTREVMPFLRTCIIKYLQGFRFVSCSCNVDVDMYWRRLADYSKCLDGIASLNGKRGQTQRAPD